MITVAFDTSYGAALAVQKGTEAPRHANLPMAERDSDRKLVPWLVAFLAADGLAPADVQRWNVGTGPGSFSGLRAGIAFVKGVCTASGALYRGLPSSLALAGAVADQVADGERIGVLHDARRGQLILSTYVKASGVRPEGEVAVVDSAQLEALCGRCRRLVTVHGEVVRRLLPENSLTLLVTCDCVDARLLLDPPDWPWPADLDAAEKSTEPIYVRPPVFVKPKPVTTIVQ